MKGIKLILAVLIIFILSFFSIGCVKIPLLTPEPAPTATVNETAIANTPVATTEATARNPVRYIVFVDDYYGFRKVIEANYKPVVGYENLTLTIYAGDTVEWRNDVDFRLTLISDQGLWAQDEIRAVLIDRGFNYTFTNPGTYTFRIKEETGIKPQTIIVKP